ncbi:MAG: hypothetical protein WCF84_11735 [Anaerolineae bacterium]
MPKTLNCPHCGAPLDYAGDAATIRCPFCSTSVVVPPELRPPTAPTVEIIPLAPVETTSPRGLTRFLPVLVILAIIGGVFGIIYVNINSAFDQTQQQIDQQNRRIQATSQTAQAQARTAAAQAAIRTATPAPTATPTPGFATVALKFGSAGIAPGSFQNARSMTVDNNGHILVADDAGGRVQVFDTTGKYSSQWMVGDSQTTILSLAANRKGAVYVNADGDILRYDIAAGKLLGQLPNPGGSGYGDMALRADGGLLAIWYESRWGMITSLAGHREDLIRFDNQGQVLHTYPSLISGQTDTYALDTRLAVDGLGTIYALDAESQILFKFSPEGKFITRLVTAGSRPDQLSGAQALAIDGSGHLYVAGSRGIQVFDPNGVYLGAFAQQVYSNVLAVDDAGAIWVLGQDQVLKYTLTGK